MKIGIHPNNVVKLIASKSFDYTQINLKRPSFSKQVLKRSIVPNFETVTKHGLSFQLGGQNRACDPRIKVQDASSTTRDLVPLVGWGEVHSGNGTKVV